MASILAFLIKTLLLKLILFLIIIVTIFQIFLKALKKRRCCINSLQLAEILFIHMHPHTRIKYLCR